jgi:hypothetical protein
MTTISEVIARLEQIVAWAKAEQSPLGYFAAVYLSMTRAVRDAIERGEFENGSRMEQMDVVFARRYVDAFDAWQAGRPTTQSWQLAFEASKDERLCAMQHILLGMNAHINLDLGIAAATVRQRDAIFGLRRDFDRINDIIASLVNRTQEQLAEIWLPFAWLDHLLRTEDEGYINFSIRVARGAAWKAALALAFTPDADTEQQTVRKLDDAVAFFAKKILRPGILLGWAVWLMCRSERGTVREKIGALLECDI